jgi:hypothetical protein
MNAEDENTKIKIELLENMTNHAQTETSRLEKFTDRILAKLASIITLSGILTFLSFAFLPGRDQTAMIYFYLIWVFPYLLIGIVLWIFTLQKSQAIIAKEVPFIASTNLAVKLQYAEAIHQMNQGIYSATHRIYQTTRKLFGFSLGFVVAYLTVYVITFYLFTFAQLPSNTSMILITIIALLLINSFRKWYSGVKIAVDVSAEVKIPIENNPPSKTK